jgi:phosphatidylserine/phosphatidylglycerophosphate/cardiolipin synthase-like enzyme
VDGRYSVIGSFNLDPRSEFRDTQVAVLVDDVRLAQRLRRSMDWNLANSDRVFGPTVQAVQEVARPAPLPAPYQHPGGPAEVPQQRRILLGISRLFAPLINKDL